MKKIDELAAQDLMLARLIDAVYGQQEAFGDLVDLLGPEYDRLVGGEPWRKGARTVHRYWQGHATGAHELKTWARRFALPWLEAVLKIHAERPTMKKHGVAVRVARRLTASGHRVHWKTVENWIDALGGLEHINDRWV